MKNILNITSFLFILVFLLSSCGDTTPPDTTNQPDPKGSEVVNPPQTTGSQGPSIDHSKSPETEWTVEVSPKEGYKVGDEVTVQFKAKVIDENWHIYSSIPSEEMAYTPTEFYLFEDEAKDVEKVGEMTENVAPYEEFDEIMEGTVRFFKEHEVTFSQTFKITGSSPAILGELFGQICLAPEAGGQCKPLRLPFTYTFSAE